MEVYLVEYLRMQKVFKSALSAALYLEKMTGIMHEISVKEIEEFNFFIDKVDNKVCKITKLAVE